MKQIDYTKAFNKMSEAIVAYLGSKCTLIDEKNNKECTVRYGMAGDEAVLPTEVVIPEYSKMIYILVKDIPDDFNIRINQTKVRFSKAKFTNKILYNLIWFQEHEAAETTPIIECLVGYNRNERRTT